jgi:predicted nucleotide-binding protein
MAKTTRGVSTPLNHIPTISSENALRKLKKLLDQIEDVRLGDRRSAAFLTWKGDVRITLAEHYGESSLPYRQFLGIKFAPSVYFNGQPESEFVMHFNSGLDQAQGFLESRINDLRERVAELGQRPETALVIPNSDNRKIFVVHGHDQGAKDTVARFLAKLDLEPIILHEQPDRGRTIIEKFEAHASDVKCAVVLLTADDVANSKENPDENEQRARQNVIFELGFFVGKLGRGSTLALVGRNVVTPSDIDGVIYIPMDEADWRLRLVKEMKAAGVDVDANRAL